MNITFSVEQVSKTGNLQYNLIFLQHKLDLMARFKKTKSGKLKLKQFEIMKELGC